MVYNISSFRGKSNPKSKKKSFSTAPDRNRGVSVSENNVTQAEKRGEWMLFVERHWLFAHGNGLSWRSSWGISRIQAVRPWKRDFPDGLSWGISRIQAVRPWKRDLTGVARIQVDKHALIHMQRQKTMAPAYAFSHSRSRIWRATTDGRSETTPAALLRRVRSS